MTETGEGDVMKKILLGMIVIGALAVGSNASALGCDVVKCPPGTVPSPSGCACIPVEAGCDVVKCPPGTIPNASGCACIPDDAACIMEAVDLHQLCLEAGADPASAADYLVCLIEYCHCSGRLCIRCKPPERCF